jgi:hypothetical protein
MHLTTCKACSEERQSPLHGEKVTAAAGRRASVSSTSHSHIEPLAVFSLVATQLPIHRFTGCGTPMIFRDSAGTSFSIR